MIICEHQFTQPKKENSDYSQHEVDFYVGVLPGEGLPFHRLSLRKNLGTGYFEVYRYYFHRQRVTLNGILDDTDPLLFKEEVVYSNPELRWALDFANGECNKLPGYRRHDWVCRHVSPIKSFGCPGEKKIEVSGE